MVDLFKVEGIKRGDPSTYMRDLVATLARRSLDAPGLSFRCGVHAPLVEAEQGKARRSSLLMDTVVSHIHNQV